jgi:hypothetical protein
MLYLLDELSCIIAIDLANGEKFTFPETRGCRAIKALITTGKHPLLYYTKLLSYSRNVFSLNLDTEEVFHSNIKCKDTRAINDDILVTFEDGYINQYDFRIKTLPLISSQFFDIKERYNSLQIRGDKIIFNLTLVYDLKSLQLLGSINLAGNIQCFYNGKIYDVMYNDGLADIKVYDLAKFEHVEILIANIETQDIREFSIVGNKLVITYISNNRGTFNVITFDLDDNGSGIPTHLSRPLCCDCPFAIIA